MMTYEEFKEQFHVKLNEQQEEAVQAIDGPCLLLAVPGSGKTTVLVNRLGYMIYGRGIAPENILVLTYTVAATKDMAERFYSVFGDEYKDRLEFRTINGISAKIILYFSHLIGRPSFALEADEGQRKKRIASIYRMKTKEYPTESDIKDVSTALTFIKNKMMTDDEIRQFSERFAYPLYDIYKEYTDGMKREQKMDYDDQMIYALAILKRSKETLEYFRNLYQYICVDEAQDTSKVQHALINILAGERENLLMVADEDQSIYGFRSADPLALLSYEKDHKGAKVLLMETNFRSNAKIVEAANGFIQKNKFRHKKVLKAHRPAGKDVRRAGVNGRAGQYEYILKEIEQDKETETAVLYRENESMIPMVDLLDRHGIPFRMKNTELTFFSHRITIDILSMFRFAKDPRDVKEFMNLYYKLGLYLSRAEAEKICTLAAEKEVDILEAGMLCKDELRIPSIWEDFVRKVYTLKNLEPEVAVDYISGSMGYEKYLKKRNISGGKLNVLKDVFSRCKTMDECLSRIGELQQIIESAKPYGDSNLILSTIHSSKGLEYTKVFLLDIIDGIFPSQIPNKKSKKEEWEAYEEERRIFYVGATRAKDELVLFYTGQPSQFIGEFRPEEAKPKMTQKGFSFTFT